MQVGSRLVTWGVPESTLSTSRVAGKDLIAGRKGEVADMYDATIAPVSVCRHQRAPAVGECAEAIEFGTSITCLLYTSDAADE